MKRKPEAASGAKEGGAGRRRASSDHGAQVDGPPRGRMASSLLPSRALPKAFVAAVERIEQEAGRPVLLFVHSEEPEYHDIDDDLYELFALSTEALPTAVAPAVLIDSRGGSPRIAYKLALMFQERYGGYVALVPRRAQSAATLLVLGAEGIVLGADGELGPLDAHLFDPTREEFGPAVNEVVALQRLAAEAHLMALALLAALREQVRKPTLELLPSVLEYTALFMRPLVDKIDTVHYSSMTRIMKVAEDYALRLLLPRYEAKQAEYIASRLSLGYPAHDFVIERGEATRLGLDVDGPTPTIAEAFATINRHLYASTITAFGTLVEHQDV